MSTCNIHLREEPTPSTESQSLNTVAEEDSGGHGSSEMVVAFHGKSPQTLKTVGRGHDKDSDDGSSDEEDEDDPLMPGSQNQASGNLLKKTCSKKSLKICCCPLLLTTTICIVAVVAATITTSFLLNNNSSPFFVNTTFNSTVVVPLKKFTKQFTITSTRKSLDDYSCTLASITLPCNDLSKSYLKNQSVDDISNDLGNLYMYLLRGSVMHFRFDSYSNCPSYTLWIFPDKLNNQVEFPIPCTSLNEHKLKGKCNTFAGSGTFDYTVPKDAYYFYVKYNCEQGVSKLSLTIDYYWYNFTQYVNNSGVQAVYIPPGKHWVIAATSSFSESFSRMCTLIQTPNIYDCRALHSFESSVYISQITLYPEIWVLCIMPVVFVSLVVFIGTLLGYTLLFIKEVKKGHIQPQ